MRKICSLLLLLLTGCANSEAQMTTRVVKDNLFIPWELVYGPDNHIWFTQKNGYICRMDPATGHTDTLYHEANTVIRSEGGMLGMALHPDFDNQPLVYVVYNYEQGGDYRQRLVRYTYNGNSLGNSVVLLEGIDASNIHNGSRLLIVDNYLYMTTGDAATASVAQDSTHLNGKVLRLNLDGSIPGDNPIAGSPVYSWGHRNIQGLVYANGRFYASEHGATSNDEINILAPGRNFGWPNVEGYCNTPAELSFCNTHNIAEPIEAWTPTLAVCGIDYYDHPMFPQLKQTLLMTSLKAAQLYQLKLNSSFDDVTDATALSNISFGRLRDICISPEGRIYISTSNSAAGGGSFTDKIIEIYDPSYVTVEAAAPMPPGIEVYPNPATNQIHVICKTGPGEGIC